MLLGLRLFVSVGLTALLMFLVWLQIVAANEDRYATVEQLRDRGLMGLSFDRHYAMPLDFCIIAPFVGLVFFCCSRQWSLGSVVISAVISVCFILFCMFVLWIGGREAHVHDGQVTPAGWFHGLFAMVAVWALIMLLVYTPRPEPMLILVSCIVVPAFLFVGTHMFLGLINYRLAAGALQIMPLRDPVGWAVLIVGTGLVWWRAYVLIPSSFWVQFN